MSRAIGFLAPEKTKLLFVAQWLIFSALFLARFGRREFMVIANLVIVLAFLYLCGCVLVAATRSLQVGHVRLGRLSLIALGLAGLDHTLKAFAYVQFRLGEFVTIVPGVLTYRHGENPAGSWLLATYGQGSLVNAGSLVAILAVLATMPAFYQFYLHRHRRFRWPAVAYVCLAAGFLSFAVDVVVRGTVVDYIGVVGVTTADLKDVLLLFGVAASAAEAVESPAISLRWSGWRGELCEVRELVGSFIQFVSTGLFGKRR